MLFDISKTNIRIKSGIAALLMPAAAAGIMAGTSSCSMIYEDLDPCPRGVVLRFVYDYNMEFANAFPAQVDCLSVFLFDSDGQLVERRTETTEVLRDEGYRMTFDLPAADYKVVAYGGLECDLSSFSHTMAIENIRDISDLEVRINGDHVGDIDKRPGRPLHDLFHGAISFTVTEGTDYERITVPMIKDTNHLRIVLQHLDNTPVDDKDFKFEIVDDNILFDCDNNVLSDRQVNYSPWTTGTTDAGIVNGEPLQVAFAELSVSRLMNNSAFVWESEGKKQNGPRLRITSLENGRVVADLPLVNYLLILKSEALASMDSQEFLDRVSRWNMIFFLDRDNAWVRMNIVVDDWTVRINNIKFD